MDVARRPEPGADTDPRSASGGRATASVASPTPSGRPDTTMALRNRLGFHDELLWKRFCVRRLSIIHALNLNTRKASEQEGQVQTVAQRLCAEYGYPQTAIRDFEKLIRAGIQSVRRNQKRSPRNHQHNMRYPSSGMSSSIVPAVGASMDHSHPSRHLPIPLVASTNATTPISTTTVDTIASSSAAIPPQQAVNGSVGISIPTHIHSTMHDQMSASLYPSNLPSTAASTPLVLGGRVSNSSIGTNSAGGSNNAKNTTGINGLSSSGVVTNSVMSTGADAVQGAVNAHASSSPFGPTDLSSTSSSQVHLEEAASTLKNLISVGASQVVSQDLLMIAGESLIRLAVATSVAQSPNKSPPLEIISELNDSVTGGKFASTILSLLRGSSGHTDLRLILGMATVTNPMSAIESIKTILTILQTPQSDKNYSSPSNSYLHTPQDVLVQTSQHFSQHHPMANHLTYVTHAYSQHPEVQVYGQHVPTVVLPSTLGQAQSSSRVDQSQGGHDGEITQLTPVLATHSQSPDLSVMSVDQKDTLRSDKTGTEDNKPTLPNDAKETTDLDAKNNSSQAELGQPKIPHTTESLPSIGVPSSNDRQVLLRFQGKRLELTFSPLKNSPPTLAEIFDHGRRTFSIGADVVIRLRDVIQGRIIDSNSDLLDAFSCQIVDLELFLPPPMLPLTGSNGSLSTSSPLPPLQASAKCGFTPLVPMVLPPLMSLPLLPSHESFASSPLKGAPTTDSSAKR